MPCLMCCPWVPHQLQMSVLPELDVRGCQALLGQVLAAGIPCPSVCCMAKVSWVTVHPMRGLPCSESCATTRPVTGGDSDSWCLDVQLCLVQLPPLLCPHTPVLGVWLC